MGPAWEAPRTALLLCSRSWRATSMPCRCCRLECAQASLVFDRTPKVLSRSSSSLDYPATVTTTYSPLLTSTRPRICVDVGELQTTRHTWSNAYETGLVLIGRFVNLALPVSPPFRTVEKGVRRPD
ncbi:hypothetical protein F5Y17DRAFT_211114 [Xylariaceae sp. FL0594]|nr:hypothetical protein F5Y17DRAFT_211114 [Xylariaceae sp. FL0594]